MKTITHKAYGLGTFLALNLLTVHNALADGASPPAKIDTGDTAWVLVASALVLLMTPGLGFFYAGMVRTKNVVSTLYQNYIAIGVVGVVWAIAGYSLAFSGNVGGIVGDLNALFLRGVGQEPNADLAATIPQLVFMMFQCMFAIITPALISGAIAERVSFRGWLAFLVGWSLFIYSPICHWVWGVGGWIRNLGGLDFAGGLVVHMSAGYSALVLAYLLGKRKDPEIQNAKPYSPGYVLLGAGLLLFGWFGFNAGSALASNGLAAHAFTTTFLAAATAMLSWPLADVFQGKKPSSIGASCGLVVGLVAITPCAGFVSVPTSLLVGTLAGIICCLSAAFVKSKIPAVDDTLDVFACHGVGGTLGVILTGLFATKAVNSGGGDGLLYGSTQVFSANCLGILGVIAISVVGTAILYTVVNALFGFRANEKEEITGLDVSQHDETIESNVTGKGNVVSLKKAA